MCVSQWATRSYWDTHGRNGRTFLYSSSWQQGWPSGAAGLILVCSDCRNACACSKLLQLKSQFALVKAQIAHGCSQYKSLQVPHRSHERTSPSLPAENSNFQGVKHHLIPGYTIRPSKIFQGFSLGELRALTFPKFLGPSKSSIFASLLLITCVQHKAVLVVVDLGKEIMVWWCETIPSTSNFQVCLKIGYPKI